MEISHNCIVTIRYKLTNEREELLDESPEGEPLVYMHGAAGVLPALEAALEGKQVGENFDLTVTPLDGFGEHQPSLLQTVPRSAFAGVGELEIGQQISVRTEQGEQSVVVTAFDDNTITIDANHPLTGMTLRFEGDIKDIRAATAEEVRHWPNPLPSGDEPSA